MKLPAVRESSNRTQPISSSGSPKRFIGVPAMMFLHAFFVEDLAVLFGGKKAGADRVHADVVRRQLAGDVLRQVDHGRLRRRVGEHARERLVGRDAADVEDRAAAAASAMWRPKIWQPKCVLLRFVVEYAVPVFVAELRDRCWRSLTPAQLTSMSTWPRSLSVSRSSPSIEARLVTSTGRYAAWPPSFSIAATRSRPSLFVAAGDDDKRAGLGESVADRAAEDARAADDDRGLAGEAKQFIEVILRHAMRR